MSFLGIVGGAMQGGGEAGTKALHQEQEYEDKSDLQQQWVQALQEKEMAVNQQLQGYHVQNAATDFANNKVLHTMDNDAAMNRTIYTPDAEDDRTDAMIQGNKDVANIHEEGANARTAAEIASQRQRDAIANTHYTPSADGSIIATRPNKDGTYTSTLLTDQNGKPIIGVKNVPEAVLKQFDGTMTIARARLASNPDDKQALDMVNDAMSMLNSYSGGGGGGAKVPPLPDLSGKAEQADVQTLLSNPTPAAMKSFDSAYSKVYPQPGLAARIVAQAKAAQGGGASAPAAPAAPAVGDAYAANAASDATPVTAPAPVSAPIVKSAMNTSPAGAYSTKNPPSTDGDKSKFVSRQATRYSY